MKIMIKIISVLILFISVLSAQTKQNKKIDTIIFFEPFNTSGWQSYVYLDLISRKYNKLDLKVYPFIRKNDAGWYSSYGDAEIKEAARFEALVEKYPSKLNDYLRVRVVSMSIDGWKDALVYAGINPVEFDNYVNKNKDVLLKNAYERIQSSKITNPGVYILGEYFSSFSKITDAMDKINKFFNEGEKINLYYSELSKIKPPRFITIYDAQTQSWLDANIYTSFKNMFGDINDERIEFDKVDEKLRSKIIALPAYLIEKKSNVVEYLSAAVKQQLMDDIGDYYVYYDMRSMAKLLKKETTDSKLEVFIMSQCPFGVKALESIIDYMDNNKINKKNIEVHYIGDVLSNPDGSYIFNSLHGDEEWKEDMRQIIISKYYPEKYWDYIKKRVKNYNSTEWENIASEVGINVNDMKNKIETEGKKLLAEDFKYANSLKINVSPTFLVNGNMVVVGISNLKKMKGYEDIKIDVSQTGGCGK